MASGTNHTNRNEPERPYSAEKARQGEIILRTRTRKIIFIGGLVLFVVVVLILRLAF